MIYMGGNIPTTYDDWRTKIIEIDQLNRSHHGRVLETPRFQTRGKKGGKHRQPPIQPLAGPSYYRPPPITTQQTGNKGVEGPTRGDGPVPMEIDRRKAGSKRGVRCYNCGKFGHYSKDCRSPRRPQGPQNQVRAVEAQPRAQTQNARKPSTQQIRAFISELTQDERDVALDQMIKDQD